MIFQVRCYRLFTALCLEAHPVGLARGFHTTRLTERRSAPEYRTVVPIHHLVHSHSDAEEKKACN